MSTNEDIHQLEVTLENAKEAVAAKDACNRLTDNKDFQKIVVEGYLQNFAARQVMLRADPEFKDPEKQADVLKAIDGIGQFRMFMLNIMAQGTAAQNAIEGDEATLEEIRNEGGE